MPNVMTASNGKKAVVYYAIALMVLIFDQLTKVYFNTTFKLHETMEIIPPVLNWTLAYNHGAAFSFLADQSGWQKWLFALLGFGVSVFLVGYLYRLPQNARLLAVGFALILGGAIGNVIDRMIYGYVIDFIHVHYADVWHYPVFNIADIGICVGTALVVWDMLFLEKKR